MRRRLTEITIVILGILIGGLTNVATGSLPEDWKPYLWLSWLPLALFVLLVVVLEWRASRYETPAAAGDTHPPAPIAQNIVTNSAGDPAGVGGPRVQSNVAVGENRGTVIGTSIGTLAIQQAQAATALHQLRAPVGDFVGREQEIAQLMHALRNAASGGASAGISGVRGMGGIGKTELAYLVAGRLKDTFPDAQLVVELRGASATPLTPEGALQAVIRAFEREAKLPDDLSQLQALYRDKLSGKQVLILADDAKDAAQIRPLLPPHGCALLVTSRNHFSLPGMAAFALGTLPKADAEKLLLEICPRIGEHAPTLAQLCGDLPLALRVSASLLANSSRSVQDYLEQLEAERLKYLSDPDNPDDPAASVEASLRLSYNALEPSEQAALAQMSVFPTSFDPTAATAVVESEGNTEAVVDLLQRRSLVEWDTQSERYSLHDLVRAFATARLEGAAAVWLRYARHYAEVTAVTDWFYLKGGAATLTGLALFDRERTHIDASWGWARQQAGDPDADGLVLAFANTTAYVGDLRYDKRRERIPQLEAALVAARELGDRRSEGQALGNLGLAYYSLGYVQRAITFHEQSLAIAHARGDRRSEGTILGNLGIAYYVLGDVRRAVPFYEQHLEIARELGDRRGEGQALGNLGNAYHSLGDARKAITYHEQALVIDREIGDRRGEGEDLGNLGNAYKNLGDARKAITYHEQRLAIARELGDRLGEGNALGSLGIAHYALADARRAVSFYEQHLEIARELGDRRGEGQALGNLATAYYALGDARQAITAYEQALVIDREIGDRWGEGEDLGNLGNAYYALGDARQAITAYEQHLEIARELGDRRGEANTSWNLGVALEQEGHLAQAVAAMQVCVDFEQEIGHPDAQKYAARLDRVRQRLG